MAYREIKIQDVTVDAQLNRNITVAPLHQSYALCVEYMKHWFLKKFEKDFFLGFISTVVMSLVRL